MDSLLSTVHRFVSTETLVSLTLLSIVFFVGSLIAIPFILVRLPADFFDIRVPRPWMKDHHPVLRVLGHLVKNVVGAIFLFAGFLMLFLPGQGILTILIGVSMLDFPGKRKLEAKMIGQPTILSAINGMRERFGKPPLTIAPDK
ncbi:MAG TPA: PGPGW domain-containing protein [Nitrospiraceae bacterium]|nr:PGPGW domain-containing protein [Nitrospiraceae bacterium]